MNKENSINCNQAELDALRQQLPAAVNPYNTKLRIEKLELVLARDRAELALWRLAQPDPDAWPNEQAAAKRALASNSVALMKLRLAELQAKRKPAEGRASEAAKAGNMDLANKLWGYRNESYDTVVALEARIDLLEGKTNEGN